jgi:hypothetical protein
MMMPDPFHNLTVPDPQIEPNEKLKLTLLSSRRSSLLGVAFVVVPLIFLFSMIMKHEFGVNLHLFDLIGNFLLAMDKNPVTHWLSPVIFGFLPLVAIALNLLAIMHVSYVRERRLLTVTIKMKLQNLVPLFFAGAVLALVFIYQFAETFRVAKN